MRRAFRRVCAAALACGLAATCGCGPRAQPLQAETAEQPAAPRRSPLRPVMFYVPNRVLDLLDTVSLGLAVPSIPYLLPASIHANVHATRAMQAGAGGTQGIFLGKGYRRQFAWRLIHHELSVGPLTVCDLEYSAATDTEVERVGVLVPSDEPFAEGYMDYWALGAHAGLLVVAVEADVHPLELADAVLGFLLIDLSGDDL
ncbi:MAG: hypothetical protein ACLF0G_17955 [Candidatus Brocadiia bacterium]